MFSRGRWEKLRDVLTNHVIYAVATRDWTGQLGNYRSNPIVDNNYSDVTGDEYSWTSSLERNRGIRWPDISALLWVNIGPTFEKHRASQRCTTVYCLLKLAYISEKSHRIIISSHRPNYHLTPDSNQSDSSFSHVTYWGNVEWAWFGVDMNTSVKSEKIPPPPQNIPG